MMFDVVDIDLRKHERLKNAKFSNLIFKACDFDYTNWENLIFTNCKLDQCKLRTSTFVNTIFNHCVLNDFLIEDCELDEVSLTDGCFAHDLRVKDTSLNWRLSDFNGSKCYFKGNVHSTSSWENFLFLGTTFQDEVFDTVSFSGNLSCFGLHNCNLKDTKLRNCNAQELKLLGTTFENSDWDDMQWQDCKLEKVFLRSHKFTNVVCRGGYWQDVQVETARERDVRFEDTELINVKGLNKAKHYGLNLDEELIF